MRSIGLLLLVTLCACSDSTPPPKGNRASAFMHSADDKSSCASWGTSSVKEPTGASSSVDVAWCEADHVLFYCTAGDPRWEKDKDGNWVNLNVPRCDPKLDKRPAAAQPAPPQQAQQQPAPPPQPAPQPPAPAPAPAPTPPAPTPDAGSAAPQ